MNSIHDLRFLNLALLDLLMTFAIAVLIAWRTRFRFRWVLPVCLAVAVLAHWAPGRADHPESRLGPVPETSEALREAPVHRNRPRVTPPRPD